MLHVTDVTSKSDTNTTLAIETPQNIIPQNMHNMHNIQNMQNMQNMNMCMAPIQNCIMPNFGPNHGYFFEGMSVLKVCCVYRKLGNGYVSRPWTRSAAHGLSTCVCWTKESTQ